MCGRASTNGTLIDSRPPDQGTVHASSTLGVEVPPSRETRVRVQQIAANTSKHREMVGRRMDCYGLAIRRRTAHDGIPASGYAGRGGRHWPRRHDPRPGAVRASGRITAILIFAAGTAFYPWVPRGLRSAAEQCKLSLPRYHLTATTTPSGRPAPPAGTPGSSPASRLPACAARLPHSSGSRPASRRRSTACR